MSGGLGCAFQEFLETSKIDGALIYKYPSIQECKIAIYCTEKIIVVPREQKRKNMVLVTCRVIGTLILIR